jgi:hypothetical protein
VNMGYLRVQGHVRSSLTVRLEGGSINTGWWPSAESLVGRGNPDDRREPNG